MYCSKQYLHWIAEADQLFLINKKGPVRTLAGPFCAFLELHSPDRRRRQDADNRWKAALDFAASRKVIENDKLMQWGIVGWVDDPALAPPYGALLTIWPIQKEGPPDELTALIAKFVQ